MNEAKPKSEGRSDSDGKASERVSPRRRALLIGINNYPGTNNDLPSCVHDAETFKRILEQHYGFDDCRLLRDEEASLASVRAAISLLFADLVDGDRAVFFYSGHGNSVVRDGQREECLVLSDGQYFFDDDLVAAVAGAPGGSTTLVMDACFSGGLQKMFLSADAEQPALKIYTPPTQDLGELVSKALFPARPFCRRIQAKVGPFALSAKALVSNDDEASDASLNGLLLSACLEGETAAASSTATQGLSAFTFALVKTLAELGTRISSQALIRDATSVLRRFGFRQTPQLKDANARSLGDLAFLLLKPLQPLSSSIATPRIDAIPLPTLTATAPAADANLSALLRALVEALMRIAHANGAVVSPSSANASADWAQASATPAHDVLS